MTERYLFRGKRLDNGEWVQGYYVKLYNQHNKVTHRIYNGYAETDVDEWYPDCFDVDPATVVQCSGRRDKNGTLIFEGDIVKNRDLAFVVTWQNDDARYLCISPYSWNVSVKIIGNIHDDPGLLT